MHASSNLFDDLGDQTDQSVKLKNRCFTKAPATRKHRDFKSLDFSKTKDAAAYIREEYRSMLCDEMFDEESYCKEAIRQIVAQVQAESEQWSQVQDIVCSLQKEMEALMETRESLEKRALRAESQLLSLKRMVHHWRYRAQNAEEELMALQSERQILKFRMQNKIERHLAEDRWHHDRAIVSERIAVPSVDNQLSMITTTEVEEQPRLANVGTQEDYALCESIGHSQNGSTRSSVDLGTASQRHSQRNIKKSLDFSNISNEGSISKSRARSYRFTDQIRRIEPARLDFCSKTSDVNSGARQRINGPQAKVQLTRLEYVEPVCMTDYKEKKMARAFALKENRSVSGPIENYISFEPALKTKFLPMAPASTPSRLPFSEIFNSPFSR
ncbi:hypothetical protein KP509_30G028300 [Ceratopteris richardii]|nr:hypothetical protein KP509_30G028300 [Ceratopteris richardii]